MTALDRLRNPDHVVPMHTARLVDQVDLDWLLGEHEKDAEALREVDMRLSRPDWTVQRDRALTTTRDRLADRTGEKT